MKPASSRAFVKSYTLVAEKEIDNTFIATGYAGKKAQSGSANTL